jgi:Ni/Fe-hydrogenase subunit HybB-like protein
VLFLISWHFLLYMISLFVEFSPAVAEWLKKWKLVRFLHMLTLGAVIFGFALSTLHQSGLGVLFLMARPKIHPLWYSEFIPLLFFVSSIFAGMSMVILEGTISRRAFRGFIDADAKRFEEIILGLGKGAAITMFVYYFFKLVLFLHEGHWAHLDGFWGAWFLLEVGGLVLVPCFLFAFGARHRSIGMIRLAAALTVLGVLLNRLNISLIAFGWDAPVHYTPTWMEVVVAFSVIFAQIWVFRWVALRMPVYAKKQPDYAAAA